MPIRAFAQPTFLAECLPYVQTLQKITLNHFGGSCRNLVRRGSQPCTSRIAEPGGQPGAAVPGAHPRGAPRRAQHLRGLQQATAGDLVRQAEARLRLQGHQPDPGLLLPGPHAQLRGSAPALRLPCPGGQSILPDTGFRLRCSFCRVMVTQSRPAS